MDGLDHFATNVGYITITLLVMLFITVIAHVLARFARWLRGLLHSRWEFGHRLSLCWWILTNKHTASSRYADGKMVVEIETAAHQPSRSGYEA